MRNYEPETYGEQWAARYDDRPGTATVDPALIARLAALAHGGRVLELGIGTGRVALPLRARGVDVHGIDASPAMVARLRRKPGGDQIPVTLGDFAAVPVPGPFSLVYVVANTFFGLLTQEDQVRCFQGVAQRLAPQGAFVIEAFVPDLSRFPRGVQVAPLQIDLAQVELHVARLDPVQQQVVSQSVVLTPAGMQLYPVVLRYAWPSELDLMARLAGLRRRERWADWHGTPFGAGATRHISIYEPNLPGAPAAPDAPATAGQ